jgi:predicted phage tail protein
MTQIQGAGGGGGGGGGGCFPGYTLVDIPGGQCRIDELKPGDIVLSFDDQGQILPAKILKLHVHDSEPITRYSYWGGKHLDATPNHWVLNQFNAFVCIDTLGPDDCLIDGLGHLRPIIAKQPLEPGTVYNLTVEGQHTFIAGNIRVHNAGLGATIAGAGGGGGGGGKGGGGTTHVPTEADDSLQSVQYGSVLDLISEGEIQGIENGVKGIYLDGTPIQSSSGIDNFTGYTVVTRNGTQNQAYIPNTEGTQSEKTVNVEVTNAASVTRTVTDTDVDRVRVTVQLPALQIIEDDGDIIGHSVSIGVYIQYNGGGFTKLFDDTISGKTTNSYQRDYIVSLSGAFPVDIRVVRNSADETSARRQNRTYFSSYTEIIDEKLRYPNSALTFLRFDSRQFDTVPARKYLVRGIKVQLPSNATVDTTTYPGRVTYSGVWDGTFGAATWCADPAWCLWDLMTSTRYGAGIPASSLDRYDFFAISQYCNALVSNGRGGQEPRFSCNMLINSRDEVYNVIQEFVALFRGIAYYGAGSMVVLQDKPADPQYLLTPANVVDGLFSYSGSAQKARHTTATVAYQTYQQLGEVTYEYVELADAVAKYGIINKDIKAIGCYSQGQAHRLGKWALLSEQNLTETVTFSVSLDSGIVLRPGMVIDIADPMKAGSRQGGRISAATTTTVTLDSAPTLGGSPTISVLLPTGLVETRSISGLAGSVVTVSSAFSESPNPQSIWIIQSTGTQTQQFRVITVAEGEDGIYGITALSYNASIYAAIESDLKLSFRDVGDGGLTDPNTIPQEPIVEPAPDPPSSIDGTEHLYVDGSNVLTAFELSWIEPTVRIVANRAIKAVNYRLQYKIDNDNWQQLETTSPSIRLTGLRAGTLYVQIVSIGLTGRISSTATAQFALIGKTASPGNVQNLTIEAISANSARLRWDATVDLDVKVAGRVHIRHTNLTNGTGTWSNSVDLIPAIAGHNTEAIVPLVEGEILVKFEDDGGRQSAAETSVIVDFPDALGRLLVQSRREDADVPPFQGNKTDVFYNEDYDALTLDGDEEIDDVVDFDLLPVMDFIGDTVGTGTYEFNATLDLGASYSVDLTRFFVTRGFFPSDLIDSRNGLVDDWSDWDGGVVDSVNSKLYLRRTSDNPSGTPTWTSWQEFVNGTFLGRGFQFKAELTSNDPAENILIDELGYEATFQRRTEQSVGAVASTAGTKSITFDKAFFTGTASLGGINAYLPSVGIVAQNLATGDYFNVTNVTSTGFDVTFRNSSGTAVDRNFLWSAVGFGKGV